MELLPIAASQLEVSWGDPVAIRPGDFPKKIVPGTYDVFFSASFVFRRKDVCATIAGALTWMAVHSYV